MKRQRWRLPTANFTRLIQTTAPIDLSYTIIVAPGEGTILLAGLPTTAFTQADIDAGAVTYAHLGGELPSDSFDFEVADGSGDVSSGMFYITINPLNDEQSLDISSGQTLDEGSLTVISSTELSTSDVDNTQSELVYTLTRLPDHGTVLVGGSPATVFTQANIDADQVAFLHDGSETISDSFEFNVDDGQGAVSSGTFNIAVTPMNDPPVAADNVYGVAHGGSATFGVDYGLLYNDTDIEGDSLFVTGVTVAPLNGTVTFNADGSFTYTHNGGPTTTDSFVYEISDGNDVDTATVEIHVDECGFENTAEFLVNQGTANEPLANNQSTAQHDRLGNAAVAARDNGDYVVTWTSVGSDGSQDVYARLFDFSGNGLSDQIQVNEHLPNVTVRIQRCDGR